MNVPTYPGYVTLGDTDEIEHGDFYSFVDDPRGLFISPEDMCQAGIDNSWVRVGRAVGWARAKSGGCVWVFRKTNQ